MTKENSKAKKSKATWSHNEIIKEIKKFIRYGYNVDSIIDTMQGLIHSDIMDHSSLSDLCEDVVTKYPNYELIQKVKRSKLVINMDEKIDSYYLVDPDNIEVETINAANCKALFIKPDFSDKTYMATFDYNPYKLKKLYLDRNAWKFNLYNPPYWLNDHFYYQKEVGACDMPPIFHKFLSHLTDGDKESYEYVLDWMATMIKSRNYCILTTIGCQGIGKGVLGTLMEKMIGTSNYSLTDNRLITKEFNAQILNKRLVYVDEIKITKANEENRLKLLINDTIEVEKKGVDSKNSVNYASIYISSNDFDSIRLRGDDRRFSIIKLTDTKLINVMNQKEIEELLSDNTCGKLARYLWHREVKRRMNQVFVSDRTEEVRESALKSWEEWFIEEFCFKNKGEIVQLSIVSEQIENLFGSRTRPSRKALGKLRELYPDKFEVLRRTFDGQRLWCVQISKESK